MFSLALKVVIAISLVDTLSSALSTISFASSYGDHMVLQSTPGAVIWGFVSTNLTVDVSVDGKKHYSARVSPFNESTNTWRVVLDPTSKSMTGVDIVASDNGGGVSQLTDVLFGEVWVCSGQSNMAFLVENAFNGTREVQDANNYPFIRLFTTKKTTSKKPQDIIQVKEPWSITNNISISDHHKGTNDDNWLYMSAVCYFYGRELFRELGGKTPIGLVNTNWGGTDIESWSSPQALSKCPGSKKTDGSIRYNTMIAPLLNMTIAGVIWYQGEANSGAPELYGCQLPAMISDWREKWHLGTAGQTAPKFPFGFVQLAAWVTKDLNPSMTRWWMTAGYGFVPNAVMPNVFMATAFDLGDSKSPFGSVHPRYKQEVGIRLGRGGLAQAYDKQIQWTGPIAPTASVNVTNNNVVVTILFANESCGEGIEIHPINVSSVSQPNWSGKNPFEICSKEPCNPASFDNNTWSEAKIIGLTNDRCGVEIASSVSNPIAVRYAWRSYPCEYLGCGLYTKSDMLPPPPFVINITNRHDMN